MSRAEGFAYLGLAQESLRGARLMAEKGLPRGAVSMAYFAIHQAGRGLLASKDIEVRTHKGLLAKLRDMFAEDLGSEVLRVVARLMDLRQRADYEASGEITADAAEDAIQEATRILALAQKMLAESE